MLFDTCKFFRSKSESWFSGPSKSILDPWTDFGVETKCLRMNSKPAYPMQNLKRSPKMLSDFTYVASFPSYSGLKFEFRKFKFQISLEPEVRSENWWHHWIPRHKIHLPSLFGSHSDQLGWVDIQIFEIRTSTFEHPRTLKSHVKMDFTIVSGVKSSLAGDFSPSDKSWRRETGKCIFSTLKIF